MMAVCYLEKSSQMCCYIITLLGQLAMTKTLFTLSALSRCAIAFILLAILWCGIYWAISLP